jgi:hypothetical protein
VTTACGESYPTRVSAHGGARFETTCLGDVATVHVWVSFDFLLVSSGRFPVLFFGFLFFCLFFFSFSYFLFIKNHNILN